MVGLMFVHYVETGIDGCGMNPYNGSSSTTMCPTSLAHLDPDNEGRLQHYSNLMKFKYKMDGSVSSPEMFVNWGPAIEQGVINHFKKLSAW